MPVECNLAMPTTDEWEGEVYVEQYQPHSIFWTSNMISVFKYQVGLHTSTAVDMMAS